MVAMCLVKGLGKRWNILKHFFFKHAKSSWDFCEEMIRWIATPLQYRLLPFGASLTCMPRSRIVPYIVPFYWKCLTYIKIQSIIQCILLFKGGVNFHLLPNVSPLSSSLAQLPPNAVTSIIDGLKRLYIEKPKPPEVAYLSFAKWRCSDLSSFVVKFQL